MNYKQQNLELANKALRRYINELEQKIFRYERILQRCPKFRMEQSEPTQSVCAEDWLVSPDQPFRRLPNYSALYRQNRKPSAPEPPADDEWFTLDEDFYEDDLSDDEFEDDEFADE